MSLTEKYVVYLARVRFVEISAFKIRPVIALSKPRGTYNIITVVPIFSNKNLEEIDVDLVNWQNAGLSVASVARIHRLSSMAQVDLLEEIGRLDEEDIKLVKLALNRHFEI